MTNKLTPQQLLEIAKVVEPNKKWKIIDNFRKENRVAVINKFHGEYEPHKPTDRGQAQLIKVVFAVYSNCLDGKLITLFGMAITRGDVNDMLSLAHEVLCND